MGFKSIHGGVALILSSLLFSVQSELIVRRPANNVGNLLISEDNSHSHYNDQRLMVFFDLDCLNSSINSDSSIDIDSSSDEYSNKQSSLLDSIISKHYPCLSHTVDDNGDTSHYQHSTSSHNYGVSFLDIDSDNNCITDDASETSLNYTDHCLNMVTYEPLYHYGTFEDSSYSTLTPGVDFDCITVDASDRDTQWGLDASDSWQLDGLYTYPNMSFDNGVDLYIVDGGVLDTHVEFVNNVVSHELGDGPARVYYNNSWHTESHGTHVAGIAGGVNVGHSKNLNIYDYTVCGFLEVNGLWNLCFGSKILSALDKINKKLAGNTRRGVINLSLGGSKSFFSYADEYYFNEIRSHGGIVVVAAGNSYADACDYSPAFTSSAITVGATNFTHGKPNATYSTAWFSNWGSCVDIWAPGSSIYSAIATNNTGYASWGGTSMASPAVAGMVANLLWVEPSLSLYEIKTILQANSVSVEPDWYTTYFSGGACDDSDDTTFYRCLQNIYQCDVIPSDNFGINETLQPTTTDVNPDDYVGYDGIDDSSCNQLAIVTIDRTQTDSSNYKNYSISEINYVITDKCIASQEGADQYYSYSVNCISNDTAYLVAWDDENCGNGSENGTIVKEIVTGLIDGDDWFVVDCDNQYALENEDINDYDESDCDLVLRYWFAQDYKVEPNPLTGVNETQCIYNESYTFYYDESEVIDACYLTVYNGSEYYYQYECDVDTVNKKYYYGGDGCDEDYYFGTYTYLNDTCYGDQGFRLEILECGMAAESNYTTTTTAGDNGNVSTIISMDDDASYKMVVTFGTVVSLFVALLGLGL